MEINESPTDRIVRGVLSVGMLWVGTRALSAGRIRPWQLGVAAVGAFLGITAITGQCQVYRAFGISTCNRC